MPASLENQFISDLYTSLLHLSGAELGNKVNQVYDGVGNRTGIALSGEQVIINGYVQPIGFTAKDEPQIWVDTFFPVGVIHLSVVNENPGVRIAGTTWEQVAQGKFIVGVGVGTDRNDTSKEFGPEDTGAGNEEGEYSHGLTENELASHGHEANIGAAPALIPSDGGVVVDGQEFQAGVATTVTTDYQAQQQVLFELNDWVKANYNFKDPFFGSDNNKRAKKFLDPSGELGSAADYTAERRAKLVAYGYKEVQGIFNGQTRFLDNRTPSRRVSGSPRDKFTMYTKALALGAGKGPNNTNLVVDVGAGPLGTPIGTVTEPVTTVERIEGSENFSTTDNTGNSENHNNIPPGYGVYVWKRTA
jgi:hypothetical protein|tara:strand:- start:3176 stop:4255 length:1080 start_codon:yes stop_codon:yes gene_type:complete